jgi:hypothetical protein
MSAYRQRQKWLAFFSAGASSPAIQAGMLWIFFSVLFVFLRSQQYTAVDGPVRCVEVFYRQDIFFHGNNHLLYPFNVLMWHRFLSLFGVSATNAFEFIRLTQIMNCVAAAGCISIVYWLTRVGTGSKRVSLFIACGYAFSRAFLLHATNSAEPMVGLFWSLLALLLLVTSLKTDKRWIAGVSGVVLSLAMATYQSMVLITPAMLVFVLMWPLGNGNGGRRPMLRSPQLWYLVLGEGFGAAVIYGAVYRFEGIRDIAGMIRRFTTVEAGAVYGGLSLSKILNLPLGLAGNLFPILPPDFEGIRSLLRNHSSDLWISWLGFIVLSLIVFSAFSLFGFWRVRERLSTRHAAIFVAALVGLGISGLAPLYWVPEYDKLWLQPLACLYLLFGVVVSRFIDRKRWAWLLRAGVLLVAIEVISNAFWAIPSHFRATAYLAEATRVSAIVRPEDTVITDWDGISILYGTFWGQAPEPRVLTLQSIVDKDGEGTINALEKLALETSNHGGRLYFLGTLDLSEDAWNSFLGNRLGLPYHSIDPYRNQASVIARFPNGSGGEITLRRLER